MTDANFPLADDHGDDLPRTLRRQREEFDARARGNANYGAADVSYARSDADRGPSATVTRIEVPFMHLVLFFIKAALAAIPAIILLTVVLWAIGHTVQIYFPHLLKMQILVWFPPAAP